MGIFLFQYNKKHLDSKTTLKLNYDQTTIKDTDVKLNLNSLSVNYNIVTQPTIVYPNVSTTYNATQIRIYGVLHKNIKDLTCDSKGKSLISKNQIVGELVVEHTSKTGGYGKVYTCFLLKKGTSSTTSNDIDNVINNYYVSDPDKHKDSVTLNLNQYITGTTAYVYSSGNDKVILVTTPIIINTSDKYVSSYVDKSTLLNVEPTDKKKTYTEIKYTKSTVVPETKVTTTPDIDKSGIYIDCKPTGESDKTIATYNVPINSEYTRDAQKLDFMKMTIHLCFVFIMVIVIYFVVPLFYKAAVIDSVNKFVNDSAINYPKIKEVIPDIYNGTDINRFVRIRTADILIIIYSIIVFGILLHEGFKGNNFDLIMWALYFAIMFGLGFSTIQFNKINRDFMKTKIKTNTGFRYEGKLYPDESQYQEPPNYLQFKDIGQFIPKAFEFIFKEHAQYNLVIMAFLACLTLFILVVCKLAKTINKWSYVYSALGYVIFFVIIPGVPTFLLSLLDSNGKLHNFT